MKYFIDAEFSERGPKYPLELISIGIVAEDGREFYRENENALSIDVNSWVRENVIPRLSLYDEEKDSYLIAGSIASIADDIDVFIGNDPSPEFWGYYCAYDWVVLCQLFGDMSCLPTGWPMYCHDLRQWLDDEALSYVSQPDDAPHHALQDARWIAQTYKEYSKAWARDTRKRMAEIRP